MRLYLDKLLPGGRRDFGLLILFRASESFDTHVSNILLNCISLYDRTHLAKDLSHKSIGKNIER